MRSRRSRLKGPSLPDHFPAELWSNVWCFLSPGDKYSAMRVCKHWRVTALADPRLWTNVAFYSARHAPRCTCARCAPRKRRGRKPEGWRAMPDFLLDQSNIHSAPAVLARSGQLHVDVRVEFMAYRTRRDDVTALADALLQRVDRITALTVLSADSAAYKLFMTHFSSFPKLQKLFSLLHDNEDGIFEVIPFSGGKVQLPELQKLHLGKGYRWPLNPGTYPNLRSLSIIAGADASRVLFLILSSCPQLEIVRVVIAPKPGERVRAGTGRTADISELSPGLERVELVNLNLSVEDSLLSALARPSLSSLSLEYAHPDNAAACWKSFGHLHDGVRLRVGHRFEWDDIPSAADYILVVEMTDSHENSRNVSLHRCDIEAMEEALAELAQHVDTRAAPIIAADRTVWPAIATAFSGRVSIGGLELVISPSAIHASVVELLERLSDNAEEDDYLSADFFAGYFGHGNISLPVPSLTLICSDARGSLDRRELEGLLRRSGIALPLDSLVIDERIALPDGNVLSELAHLARNVVFAKCNATAPSFPPPFRMREASSDSSESESSSQTDSWDGSD